ncbi:hypothetical protein KKC59_03625 [bacterium]|nr:hypothetical protein [bacterium]
MFIKKSQKILITIFAVSLVLGCSKKPKEHIVAMIGPYDLRVSDYKREASKLSYSERKALDSLETKYAFLDQLIDREVLLQEAQKLGIDKDREFMNKIEDFWEEALLEELVKLKSKEIIDKIEVNDDEVTTYYEKMKKDVYVRIVVTDKEDYSKILFRDEDIIKSKEKIQDALKDTGWEWFSYEEIDPAYRDIIFGMNAGDKKIILKQNKGYYLFFVSEYKDRELESFEKISDIIGKTIREEKELNAIDEWISSLRIGTKININREVLQYIEVE